MLSVVLAATVAAMIVMNLPESHVKREGSAVAAPYLNALGLTQNWRVLFAPDPRRYVLRLEARITTAEGRVETWRPPDQDPFIGTYRDYRWRKYVENATSEGLQALWAPLAVWLLDDAEADGLRPSRIELVRLTSDLPPPGPGAASAGPPTAIVYFTATPQEARRKAAQLR